MLPLVKIRGIYSTAVTKLLLDHNYPVTDPSPEIRERFGLSADRTLPDLEITDRRNLQGIQVTGQPEHVSRFLSFLQTHLYDAALLGLEYLKPPQNPVRAIIEIPSVSKHVLDRIRAAVCPTLRHHHQLRIIDNRMVDTIEGRLGTDPEKIAEASRQAFRQLVMAPLEECGIFKLEHIRVAGKPVRPREGAITGIEGHRLTFKRSFSSGRYDGLNLPIERGDYGITEIEEDAWQIKHSYFSIKGELKGEYYNINTPVEFYPTGGRYLDLEIDVIRRPDELPMIVDQKKPAFLAREGYISQAIADTAYKKAEELMHTLL